MKTYLTVWFTTEGEKTSEVTDRLMSIGFRPVRGNYDYVYDWEEDAALDDIIKLANRVHTTLKDCNVYYRLESIE